MQLELMSPWGGIKSPPVDISEYGRAKFPLTLGQKIAAEQIIQWLNDPHSQEYLLKGFAGTGKTTIIQLICAYLKCVAPEIEIGQCAYSHQAKKVLIKTNREAGLNLAAMTCCQMLEAKPDIDFDTGALDFRPEAKKNLTIREFNLVIVDEAFGLDSKTLTQFRNAVIGTDIKLLFLGDSAQTGPIGELHSPVSDIQGYELTEVVRYAGPILEFATRIRTNLKIIHELPGSSCCEEKLNGLWNMDSSTWTRTVHSGFKKFYDLDPYDRRILCFTNARAAEINDMVRRSIYGDRELGQFMGGERIVFKDPFSRGFSGFHTSDEAIVLDWEESSEYVEITTVDILRVRILSERGEAEIPVVKSSAMPALTKVLNKLAEEKKWRTYWKMRNQLAWVDYAYAMTTHKAKGSTFADAFVDVSDMRKALHHRGKGDPLGHIIQYNRLLYTAATRPTSRLFLGA